MTEQLTEVLSQVAPPVLDGPVRIPWATVPRVNLLPVAIVQGRRFRRTQRLLGLVVLTAVAIAGGGVFLAQRQVSGARQDLDQAQSHVRRLQTEAAKYAAVPKVVAEVDAAKTARTRVMGSDVLWYQFMNDLEGALPTGVSQDTLTVSLTPPSGTAAQAPSVPLTAAGIGSITVSGDAGQYREISSWLDSLDTITGVESPALTSAAKAAGASGNTVRYSVSAVVTDAALAHRYDKKGS